MDVGETTVAIEFNDVDALERALATGEIAVVLAEPAMTDRYVAGIAVDDVAACASPAQAAALDGG